MQKTGVHDTGSSARSHPFKASSRDSRDVRYRNYLIPAEALRADRENVVAVRIQANSTGERSGLVSTRNSVPLADPVPVLNHSFTWLAEQLHLPMLE